MKPETQIRIGLITVVFILAFLTLALIAELYGGSISSGTLIDFILIYIFGVYLQGILKKDAYIARSAYRTYFVIWLFFSVIILIGLPFWFLDKGKRIGNVVLLFSIGILTITLFFLKMGINGLMQHPDVKNKSEKVKLLWLAFLPFLIIVLFMAIFIFSPLFRFLFE